MSSWDEQRCLHQKVETERQKLVSERLQEVRNLEKEERDNRKRRNDQRLKIEAEVRADRAHKERSINLFGFLTIFILIVFVVIYFFILFVH